MQVASVKKNNVYEWMHKAHSHDSYPLPIEFYFKGIKRGKQMAISDLKKNLKMKFKKNKIKAQKMGVKFFSILNKNGFNCSVVYLMVEDMSKFRLLFLVNKDKYLSEEFKNIRSLAISERKKINKTNFYISLMFVPEVQTLDQNKIVSEGYFYSYNGKSRK